MPLGEDTRQSKFFTPAVGRYAVRLLGIHDSKPQNFDARNGMPARTGVVQAVWELAVYNQDGSPVIDPANPAQVPAISEPLTGQSTGYQGNGVPARGRFLLTPFAKGLGIPFPDDADLDTVQAIVAAATSVGAWAWFTWGPNTDKTSKTPIIIREVEPMIPQPPAMPKPVRVAAPVQAAAAPVTPPAFLGGAVAMGTPTAEAPAAPVFAPAAVAPAAPVFPGAGTTGGGTPAGGGAGTPVGAPPMAFPSFPTS